MKFLPTFKQFKKWALPSKYAVAGFFITIAVAITIFLIQIFKGSTKGNQETIITNSKNNSEMLSKIDKKLPDKHLLSNDQINTLISLRSAGDKLFTECLKFKSKDIPQISEQVMQWEKDVEKKLISNIDLNKFQSSRNRRSIGIYGGRNAEYDEWMDRLEFQVESLNEIIEER